MQATNYQLDIKFRDGHIERIECNHREVKDGVLHLYQDTESDHSFSDGVGGTYSPTIRDEIIAYSLTNIISWTVVGS